jgi:hypothetical protein
MSGYKAPQVEGGWREVWDSSDDDDNCTNASSNAQSSQKACPLRSQSGQSRNDVSSGDLLAKNAQKQKENEDLSRQLAVCKRNAENAEKKAAAYSRFVCATLSEYKESYKFLEPLLFEDKEVLCAALQTHGQKALQRAPEELREEIVQDDIKGFCNFCTYPIWITRNDPNGRRGKRRKINGTFQYFHDDCDPSRGRKCYLCNQPLKGELHCDYGTCPEGYYHIGKCPKADTVGD